MPLNMEKNKNVENFLNRVSIKDSGWMEKAKWEQENEYWLDMSFEIALRIGSILSANKKADIHPKNQVELAEAMDCSAQYVSKLMKGKENLQIETICKIGRILKVNLIEVPRLEVRQKYVNPTSSYYNPKDLLVTSPLMSAAQQFYNQIEAKADNTSYALAA